MVRSKCRVGVILASPPQHVFTIEKYLDKSKKRLPVDLKNLPIDQKKVPYFFCDTDIKDTGLYYKDEKASNWTVLPTPAQKKIIKEIRDLILKKYPPQVYVDEEELKGVKKFIRQYQKATDKYEDVYSSNKQFLDTIDDEYKVVPDPYIYRGLHVPSDVLDDLSKGIPFKLKPKIITSWSTDLSIAKKAAGRGNIVVIKIKTPKVDNIILSFVAPILGGCCDEEKEVICKGNIINSINRKNIAFPKDLT